jgi:lysyl-tRNA synthetase class 2
MPPRCAGIALGVDRLVMVLCGARSLDQVVAFPPEEA